MFTKCQNRKSFIYNKLRDFRESLQSKCIGQSDLSPDQSYGQHCVAHRQWASAIL